MILVHEAGDFLNSEREVRASAFVMKDLNSEYEVSI